jgi:hypothetical protein
MPTVPPTEAGQVLPGANRGQIPVGGAQLWSYFGRAGEIVTIRANAERPANGASEREQRERELLDTYLVVYAPDGTDLAMANDIEPGALTDSLIQDLALPASGRYAIEVRSWEDRTGGVYTLKLITEQGIVFGETVSGTVEAREHHPWTFDGTAGMTVTIEMDRHDSELDPYLALLGPGGTELVTDDDSGEGTNSRIEGFVLPETGRYTILAQGYGNSSGAYTLALIDETVDKETNP